MRFDYEVPIEEYAAGQVLYHKARSKGVFVQQALLWILLGAFFVLLVGFRFGADWLRILLLLIAAYFFYLGITYLFPTRYCRRYYPQSGLLGKNYHAELDENGFSVSGDACSWRVLWPEVLLKGEDNLVFMFTGKGTVFIFGKKYLNNEQQKAVRRFGSLS
jgi:energy-coupling factor transporter transmembrane protein EcfT